MDSNINVTRLAGHVRSARFTADGFHCNFRKWLAYANEIPHPLSIRSKKTSLNE